MNIETYIRTKGACLNFPIEKRNDVLQYIHKTILEEDRNMDTMEFGDASFFPSTNIFFGRKEINGVMGYVFYDVQSQFPIYMCNSNDGLTKEIVEQLRDEIFIPGEEKFREMYFRVQKEMLEEEKGADKAD